MELNQAALPKQAPNWQQNQAAQPKQAPDWQQNQTTPSKQAPDWQQNQAAPSKQAPNWQQNQAAQPKQAQPSQQNVTGKTGNQQQGQKQAAQGISKIAQQVIDLTNAQRRQNGLPDLKADAQLCGVAQKKSEDMQQKHYFSHTSPTYGSPFDMMRDFGVTYKSAGENIAQGQPTPQEVVQAWMNSEGHRKNILSNNFTNIGIGYDQNGNYWTQMFIGK
ncbi:SCP-like extracellular protein [Bacillus sp. S/N-304-OC-R1]|nr:SCP-like extracellular protein [Bacillus sp. S/N-304-OC-R1]